MNKIKPRKIILTIRLRHILTGIAFVTPWIIGFLFFTIRPMFDTIRMSFQQVRITGIGMFFETVGFQNYLNILTQDTEFIAALTSYLQGMILFTPLILIFSLFIAALLNMEGKFRGIFRVIFFLPVVISSGPMMNLLAAEQALNLPGNNTIIQFLFRSGVFPEAILSLFVTFIFSLVNIFWLSGLQILIFLAALQKQDSNVIEAAQIDGASPWVIFWRLTLVTLNPMIVINAIFTVVMLSVLDTNPIINKITSDMFNPVLGYGYASALTWIYFIVMILVVALSVLLTRRRAK